MQWHATVDLGYSRLKAKNSQTEKIVPHALAELSPAQYENIIKMSDGNPGPDLFQINGQAYLIGGAAVRRGTLIRRKGAARYERNYIGVLAASMLARLYPDQSCDDITVFAAHPPNDIDYVPDLMASIKGTWSVTTRGKERSYNIRRVGAYPEPLGGLMNQVLNESGTGYVNSPIPLNGYGLLLDVGGHTVNMLAVQPGGRPDYEVLIDAIPIGIDDSLQVFEGMLRQANKQAFKTMREFRPDRLRAALASEVFEAGGHRYPCSNEARAASSQLINQISDTVQGKAGGPQRWDYHVLSGGGPAMLADRITQEVLEDHPKVFLAETITEIDRANMRGGAKIAKALGY